MAMFPDSPDGFDELQKMNDKFRRVVESYLDSVENGYSYIAFQQDDVKTEFDDVCDALDEAEETLAAYRSEMRFLAKTLTDMDVSIPLEGHTINFGQYLPVNDPRRNAFSYEVEG